MPTTRVRWNWEPSTFKFDHCPAPWCAVVRRPDRHPSNSSRRVAAGRRRRRRRRRPRFASGAGQKLLLARTLDELPARWSCQVEVGLQVRNEGHDPSGETAAVEQRKSERRILEQRDNDFCTTIPLSYKSRPFGVRSGKASSLPTFGDRCSQGVESVPLHFPSRHWPSRPQFCHPL